MIKENIDFSQTGFFSELVSDFLKNDAKLSPFYKYQGKSECFVQAVKDKSKEDIDRELLTQVLEEQYDQLTDSTSQKVRDNITFIGDKKTFTVTTGHQLCIFTGPLYFIYKIISTINLARKLNDIYPGYHFVPVYWMASEDHDFAEINHIHLFGNTITWESGQSGPVGKMSLDSFSEVLQEVDKIMGDRPEAKELTSVFKKAYENSQDLAQATRVLVNELFGDDGLVILDADDPRLKRSFAGYMVADIVEQKNFSLVSETAKQLDAQYKVQVNPREINLFYLQNGVRERIEEHDGTFRVLNTDIVFTEAEIIREIERNPERFSPNVILRPLYQEVILPNVAYIGGGGELAYWMELKSMFEENKVNFPVLMLRNSVLWIDKNNDERLDKLKISHEDIFKDTEELINQFIQVHSGEEINLEQERTEIENLYAGIRNKAGQIDQTLEQAVEAEKQRHLNSLDNLEKKLIRAQKKNFETSITQITRTKEKLFPNKSLQERYDNFIPFYLRYGKQFFELLKSNIDPFQDEFIILVEK